MQRTQHSLLVEQAIVAAIAQSPQAQPGLGRSNVVACPAEHAGYVVRRQLNNLGLLFQDVLTNLPSKVVFMVDTCHSGSITGKRRSVTDLTDALRELVHAESGVVVMTASTGREVSVEHPDWGHGAFTKAILEGLEGQANYNNDRTIDIKELDLFITNRVKELTQGSQHPTTEIPKTMPNFPVVYKE